MAEKAGSGPVRIYFGSQTGQAENFAHELHSKARARGVAAEVVDLEDCGSPASFRASGAGLFLVSNTGDGEAPDNMRDFAAWTRDAATPTRALEGLRFAVFGLGDTRYMLYNRTAKDLDPALERLGASRLLPLALGNDAGDMPGDFEAWCTAVLEVLQRLDVTPAAPQAYAEPEPEPRLLLANALAELPPESPGAPADVLARFYFHLEEFQVSAVRELRQKPDVEDGLVVGSTAHVELALDANAPDLVDYAAAGTVELLPENDPADVAAMLELLEFEGRALEASDLPRYLSFAPATGSSDLARPFPTPCTLQRALGLFCDLRAPPSRRMLEALRHGLPRASAEALERLLADAAALRVVQDAHLGWTQLEFWRALGVRRLGLGLFLRHCPRQRPRSFTVASAPALAPRHVHVCVSLLSGPAPPLSEALAFLSKRGIATGADPPELRRGRVRRGLCSTWLCERLRPGGAALGRLRPSCFRLAKADVPLIMVGAGAGVAPFRALLQEARSSRPPRQAPSALFFGCRHPQRDWIYAEEMPTWGLSRLLTAFSRLSPQEASPARGAPAVHTSSRRYVQREVLAQAEAVRAWLADGGVAYVCGNDGMGEGVLEVLDSVLRGSDVSVEQLRQEGRLVTEFWGHAPNPLDIAALEPEAASEVPSKDAPSKRARVAEANGNDGRTRAPVEAALAPWEERRKGAVPQTGLLKPSLKSLCVVS